MKLSLPIKEGSRNSADLLLWFYILVMSMGLRSSLRLS